ncbi:helix-turn-helix domain-containing protein [Streptomyces roseolus]|uniref:helix-turn-helix domain-containing protein n=1 Tax=Streptomyces roseolus TaxID=67358 RepID=UPI003570EA4D
MPSTSNRTYLIAPGRPGSLITPRSCHQALSRQSAGQALLIFSLVLWVWRGRWRDPGAVSFKPSSAVSPLSRPQLSGARRVRAAVLFDQGRSGAEIARMLDVSDESVRRWRLSGRRAAPMLRAGVLPPVARPNWTMPGPNGCEPRWSRAPRHTTSRPTCGSWNESAWSSNG